MVCGTRKSCGTEPESAGVAVADDSKAGALPGYHTVGFEGGGLGATSGWHGWVVGGLDLGAGNGVEGNGGLDKGEEVSRSLCRGEGD